MNKFWYKNLPYSQHLIALFNFVECSKTSTSCGFPVALALEATAWYYWTRIVRVTVFDNVAGVQFLWEILLSRLCYTMWIVIDRLIWAMQPKKLFWKISQYCGSKFNQSMQLEFGTFCKSCAVFFLFCECRTSRQALSDTCRWKKYCQHSAVSLWNIIRSYNAALQVAFTNAFNVIVSASDVVNIVTLCQLVNC